MSDSPLPTLSDIRYAYGSMWAKHMSDDGDAQPFFERFKRIADRIEARADEIAGEAG